MTGGTRERSHGRSRRPSVAGRAFGCQPPAAPMALIARELRVFAKQRPWMLELFRHRDFRWVRNLSFLADDRVALLAILANQFSFPADMVAVMTAKTTRV